MAISPRKPIGGAHLRRSAAGLTKAAPTARLARTTKAGVVALALVSSPAHPPMHAGAPDSGAPPRCIYADITRPGAPTTWAFACSAARDTA